jgi:hypothetical protein
MMGMDVYIRYHQQMISRRKSKQKERKEKARNAHRTAGMGREMSKYFQAMLRTCLMTIIKSFVVFHTTQKKKPSLMTASFVQCEGFEIDLVLTTIPNLLA